MNNATELSVAIDIFLRNNPWIICVIIWEAVWKGLALYKSARNKQIVWYVVMLLVNTAGILPILYIAFFQKDKNAHKK